MNIHHITDKHDLNDLEKQIIRYMELNSLNLKSIGIRQMAKDNFTSTSIIYKLCDKLGFEGYSDMIYHLTTIKDNQEIDENQYIQYKESFLSLINQSKRIVVFGLGFSTSIADYMHQRLTLKGYQSLCALHTEMLQNNLDSNTVFIIISHSGKTLHLTDLLQQLKTNNIPIISFVGQKKCRVADLSTLAIPVGDYDSFSYDLNKRNTFFGECIVAFEHLLFDK